MADKERKFYELPPSERLEQLAVQAGLSPEEKDTINGNGVLTLEQADHMIENVVGVYGLPMGIAQHFLINGREVPVPMVVEEPSVVAGASFMARLARQTGGFHASASDPLMIGQMQLLNTADPHQARLSILEHKQTLLEEANRVDPMLLTLGGGARDLEVRLIEESPIGPFVVVHLIYDVRDAMGANAINSAVERLAPLIESITGGTVLLRILSNLADRRLAYARCTIRPQDLAFNQFSGEQVRDNIIAAWAFAAADPYRATTHNKGIMNGIDAVALATGNDWRAIEAGAHAYASRGGRYTSLSHWSQDSQGNLVGVLEMPLAAGVVGGATRVLPAARTALKIMGVTSSTQLAEIMVSVGLAQNLAALRALATEGIQRGHMNLHARQVAIAAGAQGEWVDQLARRLVEEKTVRIDRALEILNEWQNKKTSGGHQEHV